MVASYDAVAYDVPFWCRVTVHPDHRVSVSTRSIRRYGRSWSSEILAADSCNQGTPISESGHSRCRAWVSCSGSVLQRAHDTAAEFGQIHA